MLKNLIVPVYLLLFSVLQAQEIQITGKVIKPDSSALESVRVEIKKFALQTLTDAQGNFTLKGSVAAIERSQREIPASPILQSQRLAFQLFKQERVNLEIIAVNGSRKDCFSRSLGAGIHTLSLPSVFSNTVPGVYFLRVKIGQGTFTFRCVFLNSPAKSSLQPVSSLNASKSPVSGISASAANPDTLTFNLAWYIPKTLTLDTLKVNLGNIVLQPEATGQTIAIAIDTTSPQQMFGVSRLERALRERNQKPVIIHLPKAAGNENITVVLTTSLVEPTIKKEGFRITNANGVLKITAIDQSGAMYGLLELADMITINGLATVPEKTVNPHLAFRAIKFNTPWSSYRRHESLQLHEETAGRIEFWEGFLDMMAENRMNVLSLWTQHPFPYLIRSTNFPLACPFTNAELVKWQTFWRTLFRMAKNRGIETYLINWNIFVSQAFIDNYDNNATSDQENWANGRTSSVLEKYTRESITQVINEYPDLAGLGISLGEGMGNMTPQARQDWISRVFFEGMKAANRKIKFVYRAPFSADLGSGGSSSREVELMTRTAIESIDAVLPILTEFKFNWSHPYSTPKLVQVHGGELTDAYWNPLPQKYTVNWTIRNEDLFILRWGQPDFIRKHIELNCQSYVSGYFLGSDCYIPAKDYVHVTGHAHINWNYAWERQWLLFKQWGRLLYDPKTQDNIFEIDFNRRYGQGTGAKMVDAYKRASNMPLRFGAFCRSSSDWTLYSEGFLMPLMKPENGFDDTKSPFLSIRELMDRAVLDTDYLSVKEYVNDSLADSLDNTKITPLELALELQQHGQNSLDIVNSIVSTNKTLECEIMDVKAWSYLSLYFAKKLRAAVALETYRIKRSQPEKTRAISLLQEAKAHWQDVINVTKPHYLAIPLSHTKAAKFSWELYLDEVNDDITTATGF